MSQVQDPTPDSPVEEPPVASSPILEALIIFAISATLTRVLSDLAGISSLVSEYLFTLVAAVFLGLPYWWLTRKARSFTTHALTWDAWPRGVAFALALTLATALPFFAGYHLWRTQVLEQSFDFQWNNYLQLPVELEGAPSAMIPTEDPQVQLWRTGKTIHLRWARGKTNPGKLQVALSSKDGKLKMLHSSIPRVGQGINKPSWNLPTRHGRVHSASFRAENADDLMIAIKNKGEFITSKTLRMGPGGLRVQQLGNFDRAQGTLHLTHNLSWLPLILIAQFLLVALPEEFFYRGYLQTTLEQAWPWKKKILIFEIGPAIVVTSLLFGVGHFIINLHPSRFAVFFPSLLFGWLRDKTGTIVSCVIYYAACNLMVEAATHHYF